MRCFKLGGGVVGVDDERLRALEMDVGDDGGGEELVRGGGQEERWKIATSSRLSLSELNYGPRSLSTSFDHSFIGQIIQSPVLHQI